MRSLFKVTLLATMMAVVLHTSIAFATDTTKLAATADSKVVFRDDDQKAVYALSVSLGRCIENPLKERGKLNVKLDRDQLIASIQDTSADKNKLSDQETGQALQTFETHMKNSVQAKMEKDVVSNEVKGRAYRERFVKEKGIKTSSADLIYKVEKEGTGAVPRDSDTVAANYKGMLTDDKELDNSHTRGKPLSSHLGGAIPGRAEGPKNIEKGGRIQLVIPPDLAYDKTDVPGIPANSTPVFDVGLLDIKPAPEANVQPDVTLADKIVDSSKK